MQPYLFNYNLPADLHRHSFTDVFFMVKVTAFGKYYNIRLIDASPLDCSFVKNWDEVERQITAIADDHYKSIGREAEIENKTISYAN